MNKKTYKKINMSLFYIVPILIIIGFAITGCKKSGEGAMAGFLIRYDNCKPEGGQDCLEFKYNGSNTLGLKHSNAYFNCCPNNIFAEFTFNDNQIIITEKESASLCYCICYYDLYYQIQNIPPGTYTIRIMEPYLAAGDPVMEFTLELFSAVEDTRCIERGSPWE
ncbi:MAG: hypothetical protein MUF15_09540 [Acidobacteria bacterium]|jgi:hypothetical protein|nr:hypothetical protein [Acidobacteriota bacterium]